MDDDRGADANAEVAKVMGFGGFGMQPALKRKLQEDAVVDSTADDGPIGGGQAGPQGNTLPRPVDPRTAFTFPAINKPITFTAINQHPSQRSASPFASALTFGPLYGQQHASLTTVSEASFQTSRPALTAPDNPLRLSQPPVNSFGSPSVLGPLHDPLRSSRLTTPQASLPLVRPFVSPFAPVAAIHPPGNPQTTFTLSAPNEHPLPPRPVSHWSTVRDSRSSPFASAPASANDGPAFAQPRPFPPPIAADDQLPGSSMNSIIVIDDDDGEDENSQAGNHAAIPASPFIFTSNDPRNALVSPAVRLSLRPQQRSPHRRYTTPDLPRPIMALAERSRKRSRLSTQHTTRGRDRSVGPLADAPIIYLEELVQKATGIKIQSRELLREAFSDYKQFTKPSMIMGRKEIRVDNRMLALVGDRAIGLVLDQESWKMNLSNGESQRRTSRFLCNKHLARLGCRHGFDECIHRQGIWDIATSVEAVFGAISIEHNNQYDVLHAAMAKMGILHDDDLIEM